VRLDGDRILSISGIDPISGKKLRDYPGFAVYPATHFVLRRDKVGAAIESIKSELSDRLKELKADNKFIEAQRLQMRTEYDLEMIAETGYTHGIENYSRHLSGRMAGEPPFCLIDYFKDDFLTIIDESHATLPQLRAMYAGDRSRKMTLVEHGFRLPSALDNRPLKFTEFEKITGKTLYVSATPGPYELGLENIQIAEQIIRPTGLIDPLVIIRPVEGQVEDLLKEVKAAADKKERVLVTALTKKMAEDLTEYLQARKIRSEYIHSDVDTLKRIEILRGLRQGVFDCLVGVNLLREGLDLPEVALVAILDADKEGFLRSETSLIQVCGRAARNLDGRVIMYADRKTGSISRALSEMERRRKKQLAYNLEHNITPKSVVKAVREEKEFKDSAIKSSLARYSMPVSGRGMKENREGLLESMREDMREAADMLDFELAAAIRDKIYEIEQRRD
ncbi:MAG: excinuclease ABC subunit B, partial [Elusimicrobia bacterium]|nr:excinuclease ABC subunit B [Elusimicrobiota bacterium]